MFLVISLFAMFASLFGLLKSTLAYSEPFFLIGSRMLLAGVLMLIYVAIRNPRSLRISGKAFGMLLLLGLVNIYITNIAEIWGLARMISARACLLYSLSPFFAALFSYFLFKETLSKKKWIGLSIGFIGLCPIIFDGVFSSNSSEIFLSTEGELSLLVAVISSVLGWIILKKVLSSNDFGPFLANGVSMVFGGILALGHSYITGENWNPIPVNDFYPFIKNTLLICLISNIVCYNLYGYLLKFYSATFMSFAGLVTPLFASFFGWVLLDEKVTVEFFLAFAFFTVGLIFYHQEELRNGIKSPRGEGIVSPEPEEQSTVA